MCTSVSVIIPTFNRHDSLRRTLASLQVQTCEGFEIIVVDNAADPQLEEMLREFNRSARIPARYIAEIDIGLQQARHAGVRGSSGDLLLITDDDATFCPGWIEAYAAAFEAHPRMLAAGGPVKPVWEAPPPEWLTEYMRCCPIGRAPAWQYDDDELRLPESDTRMFLVLSLMERPPVFTLDAEGFFFGVNMAVRRSVFDWTGFHPELVGTRTIGDGEAGLNQDIARRGGLIGYVPDAVVHHHIPSRRMTVKYIRQWAWHFGGGIMYWEWRHRSRSITALSKEATTIVRGHWRKWIQACLVRRRRDPRAINIQVYTSLGWCRLRYVWWMLTDHRLQSALDATDFRP
ncbi:MAG: hypothetical protein PVSMB1_06950 [Gemmatimonadaceae bacterium]